MEFLVDVGGFGLKVFFVSLALGALLLLLFSMIRRGRDKLKCSKRSFGP